MSGSSVGRWNLRIIGQVADVREASCAAGACTTLPWIIRIGRRRGGRRRRVEGNCRYRKQSIVEIRWRRRLIGGGHEQRREDNAGTDAGDGERSQRPFR